MSEQQDQSQPQDQKPVVDISNHRNKTILELVIDNHPTTEMSEVYFIELLEFSLSLNIYEKKRVVDAIPTLSQFQIDELVKVFEDEREEFRKLMPKEWDTIKNLVDEKKREWEQLKEIYIQEKQEKEKSGQDQAQIDELKKSLGI